MFAFGFMRVEMGKEVGEGVRYLGIGGDLPPRLCIVKVRVLY